MPDRTIFYNIFLLRDVIDICSFDVNVNAGIVCLDQEKAFDGVHHSYSFSALRALDIGDVFLSWISLLYSGARCTVKMEAGLSRPIPLQRRNKAGLPYYRPALQPSY